MSAPESEAKVWLDGSLKNAFFMFIVSFDCTTDLHLNDNCYLFIAFK